MPSVHLVVPGDPAAATGGYAYDRRILESLRSSGWRTAVHALDASFPTPTRAALRGGARVLGDIPAGATVVVDGLALGGMPDLARAHARRLRLVALVHHPLALETGLAPGRAARLRRDERRALAVVRRVVVTSAATARALAGYRVRPASIGVVEPGTDRAPAARGSTGGVPHLLCVASVTPRKGHAVLVAALARIRGLAWRATFAGSLARSPATVRALRRRIEAAGLGGRVTLRGEVGPAVLARCYDRADLFVLASHHEGYGMAVAEALARGLPVVGTTAGAMPETVPAGAGVLVAPGDDRALARALEDVLTTPGLRARLARGAAAARLPTWREAGARFAAELARVRPR